MLRFSASAAVLLLGAVLLGGCQQPSQSRYAYHEVGRSSTLTFGTVVAVRDIEIAGRNTGIGGIIGGVAGAGVGSTIGSGSGSGWAAIGGLVVGAIAGALLEQAGSDRNGLEYTVALESGAMIMVAQEKEAGERVMPPGERVIVQDSGGYQRVLSAAHLAAAPTVTPVPKQE